ncbi:MAG: hypothetical protein ACL93V_16890 [Candidatus Electrothrix sp. YB6]
MLSRLLNGLLGGIGLVMLFLLVKAFLEQILHIEFNQTTICLISFLLLFFGIVTAGWAGLLHGFYLPCRRTWKSMNLYNTAICWLPVIIMVFGLDQALYKLGGDELTRITMMITVSLWGLYFIVSIDSQNYGL